MEEYRIDITVKNNLILTKIREAGYESIASFGNDNNLTKYEIIMLRDLINLRISPFDKKEGYYIDLVIKTAEGLNCSADELFTETQLKTALNSNKKTMAVSEEQLKVFIEDNNQQKLLEQIYEENQINEKLKSVVSTLTPREQLIINMLYGLNDYYGDEHTLYQVGKKLDISASRVRQIEHKALAKLRQPQRSKQIISSKDYHEDY